MLHGIIGWPVPSVKNVKIQKSSFFPIDINVNVFSCRLLNNAFWLGFILKIYLPNLLQWSINLTSFLQCHKFSVQAPIPLPRQSNLPFSQSCFN